MFINEFVTIFDNPKFRHFCLVLKLFSVYFISSNEVKGQGEAAPGQPRSQDRDKRVIISDISMLTGA